MKVGILGVGHIGKTLALAKASHEVSVANSRGPETIDIEVLATGAEAVTAQQAIKGKDVVILSIPLHRIPESAPLFADVPEETIVIDTSNYYPQRDNKIERIEAGQVDRLWVEEQLRRPIAKA
jgi:8-hydroxy-5-deazaflavin:NADPH oxidoreductase